MYVFGEFSKMPWTKKIECHKVGTNLWKVALYLKPGNKFKFCADESSFLVSDKYPQCSDGISGFNNVF